MRVITSFFALLLLAAGTGARAQDAQLMVQGMLVIASDAPGGADEKLAPYEPTLKRTLRSESFRSAGEGSTVLAMPGETTVTLSETHRLEIEGLRADVNLVRIRVRWFEGDRELMNRSLRLIRGTPAILPGPKTDKEGESLATIVLVL